MNPGERMLATLSVSKDPKSLAIFAPEMKPDDIDSDELYSATFEWLETFAKFCKGSKGFNEM